MHSGILAKAISIASSSLQQIQSIYLASLFQYPLSEAVALQPELFYKKAVPENFAKLTGASSGTGVSYEFFEILKKIFFRKTPTVAASSICTNRDLLF